MKFDRDKIMTIDYYQDENGDKVAKVKFNELGNKIIYGMHRAIASYAFEGTDIVVDYILYEKEWLSNLIISTFGLDVYFISIDASIDMINKRELARGTSPEGHARSLYKNIHKNLIYDLAIDNTNKTPKDCAVEIIDFIKNNKPAGLKQMTCCNKRND